ncbi:MAG: DnaA/Hda family protein, partial [Planctomycetota bacterium]|nr:DnaA/Hda family protein [Planctomycetota bacterium]
MPPPADWDLLRSLLRQLVARVRREQLETWFRSLNVVRADAREVELSVTSQFVRDWLQKNFMPTLQEAMTGVGDGTVDGGDADGGVADPKRRIVLTIREEDGWDCLVLLQAGSGPNHAAGSIGPAGSMGPNSIVTGLDNSLEPMRRRINAGAGNAAANPASLSGNPASLSGGGGSGGTASAGSTAATGSTGGSASGPVRRTGQLNPNYTFEKFVVGSCNRLAHASSLAIGENPGCAYNPLFVHGNVGLGKSHLLQAICHTVMKRTQHARVLYMSCEDFTNSFIQAIQTHQLDAFRDYHRSADVLVID